MFNTHAEAASKINGEIERLVRSLRTTRHGTDDYFNICRSIRELAAASASLVPPSTDE